MKKMNARKFRLGLDLGTNSLGWFIVWLDEKNKPASLGQGGVRIYPDGRDPKSGTSNAADRRDARSARKRRDRFLMRQQTLLNALIRHGLMPADDKQRKALVTFDPYELRAKALTMPLPAYHVGRALFHLNQRRGFQSNRKADKKDDEKGAIKQGAANLQKMMAEAEAPTLGAFLWLRHKEREGVRARNRSLGMKAEYEFYPTRDLFKEEFDKIWEAQSRHHKSMNSEAKAEIYNAIFHQRQLREPTIGKCTLDPASQPFEKDPEGYRVARAHPLAQRFRMLQEVRNLRIAETGAKEKNLSSEQQDHVFLALTQNNNLSFDKIRKLLKLPEEARFNLESERRDKLKGDETAERLSNKNLFGKKWRAYSFERQVEIVEKLLNESGELELISWLEKECGVDAETAERIADAPLPDGYSRLGLRALKKLVPLMQNGADYAEASKNAGYDHSKRATGEILNRLPYYGRWLQDAVVGDGDVRHTKERQFGQFPNPTVHIGLGQLRRVVNAIIKEYGAPEQIVIELARDLKISEVQKADIEREYTKNQKKNEERKAKLAEIGIGQPTGSDLLKMRLWEELGDVVKLCPFSGRPISLKQLMSSEIEVEHLIPYSDCLDNRAANKTVCFTSANRLKGKQTPYEAFGHTKEWPEIVARANTLPPNKRWRFGEDAREKINKNGRDFLERQLMETSWLGRLAKQYLGSVTDPNQVWVVTGKHTSLIRGKWGFNTLLPDHNFTDAKNRADHRHHAIDALVVALTERSLLQKISSTYDSERDKIEVPLPWKTLRDELKAVLDAMTVSHKPDHGVGGKLHDETAYGFVKEPEKEEGRNLVSRKPLSSLTENEIDRIRDRRLRDKIREFVDQEKKQGVKLSDALKKFMSAEHNDPHIKHGVRRVRLLHSKKPEYLLPLHRNGDEQPYKAYSADSNLFIEIFEKADGSWDGEAMTVFQSNQIDYKLAWRTQYQDARPVMRVYKDDLVRIDHDGMSKIARVVRLEPSARRIRLAPHYDSGSLEDRHNNPDDPFRWIFAQYDRLKEWKAERVRVDELGKIWRVAYSERRLR